MPHEFPGCFLTPPRFVVPTTILHLIAILLTLFRLGQRYKIRRLWWDDAWVGAALLLDVVYMITWWLRSDTAGEFLSFFSLWVSHIILLFAGQTPADQRRLYIALNWVTNIVGTCVLWWVPKAR